LVDTLSISTELLNNTFKFELVKSSLKITQAKADFNQFPVSGDAVFSLGFFSKITYSGFFA